MEHAERGVPAGTYIGQQGSAGLSEQVHGGGRHSCRRRRNLEDYLRGNQIAITSLIDVNEVVRMEYSVDDKHKLVLVGSDGKVEEISDAFADENLLRKWIEEANS
ncbi:MAG TPA: hypothetical protein VKE70_19475 [Candidatus Solibacter sp.]|nr:hypothetical protein [Candidatus Solibacter sp.]